MIIGDLLIALIGFELLIKLVSFNCAFDSSKFSLTITCMWCCSKVISSVWLECRDTEPKLIFDEFREQTRGRMIVAVELNVQCFVIMLPFCGKVSVRVSSPSNLNSNKKLPVGMDDELIDLSTTQLLPMTCVFRPNILVALENIESCDKRVYVDSLL